MNLWDAVLVLAAYALCVAVVVAADRRSRPPRPEWLPPRLDGPRDRSRGQAAGNARLIWQLASDHPEARRDGAALAAEWATVNGYNWRDRPALTVVLVWAARLAPAPAVTEPDGRSTREDLISAITSIDAYDETQAGALLTWMQGLDLTQSEQDDHAELAEFARHLPDQPAPDPEHCARGLDLVRGLLDAEVATRRTAARSLPDCARGFDGTEQAALTMVLVNAAVIEEDETSFNEQLHALSALHDLGSLDQGHREALRAGLRDRRLDDDQAQHIATLIAPSA